MVCSMTCLAAADPFKSWIRSKANETRNNLLAELTEWSPAEPAATATCDRDTGHTCDTGPCWLWQGPTECIRSRFFLGGYRCVCPEGYCPNKDGVCKAAFPTVHADVVSVSSASPAFPGRHADVSTGMCFSGGGIRATAWALGGLRPLVEWGLMPNVDITSSVSGGSWANAIYMFAPGKTEDIIGGPTNPTALTMDALNQDPAPGIKTCTNDYASIFESLFDTGAPLDMMMSFFACEAFLRPFGLCDMWAYMSPDEETAAQIRTSNPQLKNATFHIQRVDRPRAMVIAGTLLAPLGYGVDDQNEASLQMSPDYVGSPYYPAGGDVSYTSLARNKPPLQRLVGGGVLQGFAFGGAPTQGNQEGGQQKSVGAPAWPFSLAQAIGISSMAVGAALGNIPFVGGLLDPIYGYWPVTDAQHQSEHGMLLTKASDGGNLENSGLLPLLQRGVKKVVWFAASYQLVDRSYDLCGAPTDDDTLARAKVVDQVLDKFGFGPELSQGSPSNAVTHNQVFKREDVHAVACQLQEHLTSGTPPVINFAAEVLPNSWWGIAGGWKVQVVLVYLEHSANFEASLPSDTRRQLEMEQDGPFPGYPSYSTTLGGGTNAQYNLLAATAEYFVRENEDLFRQVLAAVPAP